MSRPQMTQLATKIKRIVLVQISNLSNKIFDTLQGKKCTIDYKKNYSNRKHKIKASKLLHSFTIKFI